MWGFNVGICPVESDPGSLASSMDHTSSRTNLTRNGEPNRLDVLGMLH